MRMRHMVYLSATEGFSVNCLCSLPAFAGLFPGAE